MEHINRESTTGIRIYREVAHEYAGLSQEQKIDLVNEVILTDPILKQARESQDANNRDLCRRATGELIKGAYGLRIYGKPSGISEEAYEFLGERDFDYKMRRPDAIEHSSLIDIQQASSKAEPMYTLLNKQTTYAQSGQQPFASLTSLGHRSGNSFDLTRDCYTSPHTVITYRPLLASPNHAGKEAQDYFKSTGGKDFPLLPAIGNYIVSVESLGLPAGLYNGPTTKNDGRGFIGRIDMRLYTPSLNQLSNLDTIFRNERDPKEAVAATESLVQATQTAAFVAYLDKKIEQGRTGEDLVRHVIEGTAFVNQPFGQRAYVDRQGQYKSTGTDTMIYSLLAPPYDHAAKAKRFMFQSSLTRIRNGENGTKVDCYTTALPQDAPNRKEVLQSNMKNITYLLEKA